MVFSVKAHQIFFSETAVPIHGRRNCIIAAPIAAQLA